MKVFSLSKDDLWRGETLHVTIELPHKDKFSSHPIFFFFGKWNSSGLSFISLSVLRELRSTVVTWNSPFPRQNPKLLSNILLFSEIEICAASVMH